MVCKNSKSPALSLFLAVLSVAVETGCYTSHVRISSASATQLELILSTEAAPPFQYDRSTIPYTNHTEEAGAAPHYQLRSLEMPSIGDNGQPGNMISARYYRSTLPGPHPLVIVLPIWGSYTYPPQKIAKSLQYRSEGAVHVFHVQGEHYLTDWPTIDAADSEETFLQLWRDAAERFRCTIIDVRRLIDWTEERPEIDSDRIGLIGFSLSAVLTGIIATQEPRLAATVSVMGGSHLHSIISSCDGNRTTRVQQRAAEAFGWGQRDLEAQLKPILEYLDSANYPNRVDPEKVLIINADRDRCLPEASREDLWLTLGRPERINMKYDHAPAFYSMTPLGFNWMRYRIWDFFEAKLLR